MAELPSSSAASIDAESEAEAFFAAAEAAEAAGEAHSPTRWHHCAGLFTRLADVEADAALAQALRERAAACRARAALLQNKAAARAREAQFKAEAQRLAEDEQRRADELALLAQRAAEEEAREAQRRRDRPSPTATVAMIGATAAYLYCGPVLAVAAATSCALGTWRSDGLGDALRLTGETAADAISHLRGFNREHGITRKAKEATTAALAAVERVEDRLLPVAPVAAAAIGTARVASTALMPGGMISRVGGLIIGDSETVSAAASLPPP